MGYTFKTFTAEVLYSYDLNNQFAKIERKLGNIKNGDISSDARITSAKLQDRYSTCYQSFLVRADTWGGTFTFEDNATQSTVTEARFYPTLPSKRAYLVGVSMGITTYSAGTGDGRIWINHNGTVLITQDVTSSGVYTVSNGEGSSAFAAPIAAVASGDYIGVQLGRTATGGSTTAKAVAITLTYKVELTS